MRRIFTEQFGKFQAGHVFDQPLSWWRQWFPDFENYTALDEPGEPTQVQLASSKAVEDEQDDAEDADSPRKKSRKRGDR